MEQEILNNIYHLYRSHIVTLILLFLLGCIAVLVAVGVIKFGLINSKLGRSMLLIVNIVSLILLLVIQIQSDIPIYKDYKESSYVVLENAKLVLKSEATGIIDRENQVIVTDSAGTQYEFKMNFDYDLSMGVDYNGTVVYSEHSNYVIWYCFD